MHLGAKINAVASAIEAVNFTCERLDTAESANGPPGIRQIRSNEQRTGSYRCMQMLDVANVQNAKRKRRRITIGAVGSHFGHVDGERACRTNGSSGAKVFVQGSGEPGIHTSLTQASNSDS